MSVAPLHEFMSENREELHAMCVRKTRALSPERSVAELHDDFGLIIDEIVRALQRAAGLPVSSPLPGDSEVARRHGGERQQAGFSLAKISLDIGAISDSVGELGAARGLSFAASEYQVFNQCIDTAIASALEQFWSQSQEQREHDVTERVGFLAHELRNALSSARLALDVLKAGEVGVNSRTGDVLDRSLRRMDHLIAQTLMSVQLRAGFEPKPRRLNLAQFLRERQEEAAPERGIRLVIEADDALEVDADERLLVTALSNFVQNALKFTHAGGTVTLRGRPDGADVSIEVEDECGGLPPGKEEELFEPYVQRGPDRRGIGLGLSIAREAIERLGGEVLVRNRPGKGCVFGVRLRAPNA
jgi:signal transduction histidine kinase